MLIEINPVLNPCLEGYTSTGRNIPNISRPNAVVNSVGSDRRRALLLRFAPHRLQNGEDNIRLKTSDGFSDIADVISNFEAHISFLEQETEIDTAGARVLGSGVLSIYGAANSEALPAEGVFFVTNLLPKNHKNLDVIRANDAYTPRTLAAAGLAKYYKYARGQGNILWDLTGANSFRQFSIIPGHDQPILHDLEPWFCPIKSMLAGNFRYAFREGLLRWYLVRAQKAGMLSTKPQKAIPGQGVDCSLFCI